MMRNIPCPIQNSRTCGALFARSFKSGTFSRSSGCDVPARGRGLSRRNLEQGRVTYFSIRAYFPGYRGLSCFAEHSKDRVSDVFHVRPSVRFMTDCRRLISNLAKGFVHDGLKNSVNRASISFGARTNE